MSSKKNATRSCACIPPSTNISPWSRFISLLSSLWNARCKAGIWRQSSSKCRSGMLQTLLNATARTFDPAGLLPMPSSPIQSPGKRNVVICSRPESFPLLDLKHPDLTTYRFLRAHPAWCRRSPRWATFEWTVSEWSRASSNASRPLDSPQSSMQQLKHALNAAWDNVTGVEYRLPEMIALPSYRSCWDSVGHRGTNRRWCT